MSRHAVVSTKAISKLNRTDVEQAALALVALNLTHPDYEDDEYVNLLDKFWEEHCPLSNVPQEALTPKARKMAEAMYNAILSRSNKMEEEMLSSADPLFRALAGPQRMTVE
jgi:hypothetical protein